MAEDGIAELLGNMGGVSTSSERPTSSVGDGSGRQRKKKKKMHESHTHRRSSAITGDGSYFNGDLDLSGIVKKEKNRGLRHHTTMAPVSYEQPAWTRARHSSKESKQNGKRNGRRQRRHGKREEKQRNKVNESKRSNDASTPRLAPKPGDVTEGSARSAVSSGSHSGSSSGRSGRGSKKHSGTTSRARHKSEKVKTASLKSQTEPKKAASAAFPAIDGSRSVARLLLEPKAKQRSAQRIMRNLGALKRPNDKPVSLTKQRIKKSNSSQGDATFLQHIPTSKPSGIKKPIAGFT